MTVGLGTFVAWSPRKKKATRRKRSQWAIDKHRVDRRALNMEMAAVKKEMAAAKKKTGGTGGYPAKRRKWRR